MLTIFFYYYFPLAWRTAKKPNALHERANPSRSHFKTPLVWVIDTRIIFGSINAIALF